MRVALNLLYLLPGVTGGTESYARGLLQGLARVDAEDEFIVFVNRESAEWPIPDVPGFRRVVCPVSASGRAARYLFEQARLPSLLSHLGGDLVHSLGYVSPLLAPCPAVVSIPDLNYQAFGDQMSAVRRLALGFFVKQSALRAAGILTISHFSRRAISQALDIAEDRITVTPLAVGTREYSLTGCWEDCATLCSLQIRRPYVVAFARPYPNKNLGRLLEAFALAKRQHSVPHQLVIVGSTPTGLSLPLDLSRGDVQLTGYLSDADRDTVLAGAEFLVLPSLYEGFGLPVLEAMAVGVPVVCSRVASLPEVAGEAAIYFDPTSVDDIARAVALAAGNPELRARLREEGYRNVRRFSWERTALATLEVYREVHRKAKHTVD